MSPEVIIIGIIVLPIVLLFLLRVNAALVFLSLCLGAVLVQFAGHDAATIIAGAAINAHATTSTVELALLFAPVILTILFMLKTVRGKSKRIFNVLPSIGVGLLALLLAVPLLPPSAKQAVMQDHLWQMVASLQSGVVALSTFICLIFLLLMRPKHAPAEEKHAKHHK